MRKCIIKNIEEFIKTSNSIFTDTITREDICRVDYDYRKEIPILDNSISVFNLMKSFNNEYLNFKKEYEDIAKRLYLNNNHTMKKHYN